MSDLDVLFPGLTAKVRGEEVAVHPFYFGQLAKVAKLVKPIAEALIASGLLTITPDSENKTSNIQLASNFIPKMFEVADGAAEPVLQLIALAIRKERMWLDAVQIDEGIDLTTKVFQVNSDFFVKRVMPMLDSKLSKYVTIGETSSPGSSVPATGDQTSTSTP